MYDDEMMDAMFYETFDFEDEAAMQEWDEYLRGDYDDYQEDPFIETGFDPYLGCYTDDC